ncbi:hypothetical protein TNIN_444531 [Trichonephila inaurata madagascariensis]|uniref:Uncharacterized protein n=1 Tax=Trichonephila inaurata madagascariensis TaxID=2747483 RepID=A0A8X7CFB7_9ARAC|nr:hypothetical protein TNIN_444531 [Trichonephila inaurata madagascariensis]
MYQKKTGRECKKEGVFELIEFKKFKSVGLKSLSGSRAPTIRNNARIDIHPEIVCLCLDSSRKQRGRSRDLHAAFFERPLLSFFSPLPLPTLPTPTASTLHAQQHTGDLLQCVLAAESPNDIAFSSEIITFRRRKRRRGNEKPKGLFQRVHIADMTPKFLKSFRFG